MSVPVVPAPDPSPLPLMIPAPPLRLVTPMADRLRQLGDMLTVAGPDAVVSHAAAAHLYGFGALVPWRAEVSTPRCDRYRVRKVRAHRSLDLGAADISEQCGLPVTTVARMLVDLSGRLSEWVLLELFDRSVAQGWVTHADLAVCCDRLRQAPGRRRSVIRALLDRRSTARPGASALALRTIAAARAAGLPAFSVDVPVASRRGLGRLALAYPDSLVAILCEPSTGRLERDAHEHLEALRSAGWRYVLVRWAMADTDIVAAIGRELTRRTWVPH